MPRLLQALAGAPQGGAEMHFLRLCLALQRAGVEQRVVIRPHPKSLEVLRGGGIEAVTAPFGGIFDRQTGKTLRREIADFRPELALTYMSRASAALPKGDFLHIADRRARTVRIDVVDATLNRRERKFHAPSRSLTRRGNHVMTVRVGGKADEFGIDLRAARPGMLELLDDNHAGAG